MKIDIELKKEFDSFDVLVAGGGLAGFAAALSAARNDAKTILVERNGFLGGLGVVGATALHNFFNIFGATPGAPRLRVAAGIAQELVDRVEEKEGAIGHIHLEKGERYISMITPMEPEITKSVLNEMLLEAGVKLLLHTTLIKVLTTTTNKIEGVVLWNKKGYSFIPAKQFIDCTGDGDLAAYAGAPCRHFKQNERGAYPAGFTFRLCNVDLEKMEQDLHNKKLITMLGHALKPGDKEPELVRIGFNIRKLGFKKGFYFYASSLCPNELTYCNCLNFGPNDGLDPERLTNGEIYIRELMLDFVELLKKKVDGCQDCYAAGAAPYIGQRRGRSVHCIYELSKEDCLEGINFEDQIGCVSFIDLGNLIVKNSGAFGIPYRAILPLKIKNLLVAGRTISPDNVAFAATRNTVPSMITGEAAGIAASMASKLKISPKNINVKKLQEKLIKNGALLEPILDPLEE
ncbi:MAG: FAD-dependent oxidoreductase [Candidatus Lokiarchaeota archaeon]|nr:FAD-dependent oxidoreductase [Candidatus Lokiarchaeota archaeon]MBD3339375.1 FAD-dependent oxidoreductase [Candidatus Lokiarchaeota archaeon]